MGKTRKATDKHVALARRYAGARGMDFKLMYIPHVDNAKRAFNSYRTLPGTLYCCLFSPVDKRGVRTQLRRYVYSKAKWQAAQERVSQVYAEAVTRAAFGIANKNAGPMWSYGADGKHHLD